MALLVNSLYCANVNQGDIRLNELGDGGGGALQERKEVVSLKECGYTNYEVYQNDPRY